MSSKRILKDKIEKSRKLISNLEKHNIIATLNETTGEITITGSEMKKPEAIKWMENNK